jgi:hypothetical protein
MKTPGKIGSACATIAVAVVMVGATTQSRAQQFTNTYIQTFDSSSSVAGWFYWYSILGNVTMTFDPTMDAGNNPASGSVLVQIPFTTTGNQQLFVGSFDDQYSYDFTETANAINFTNVTFDVHVSPTNTLDSTGDFGALNVGFYQTGTMGSVTIPASATNGWVHMSVPINQTLSGMNSIGAFEFSVLSWNGYPTNTFTFWLDNVALNQNQGPPIPPPTLSAPTKAITGLNCIATQPGQPNNRYQICTTNDPGYSFVGRSSVTYSWTIKSFPPNTDASFQQHFFIVNGAPGQYDQAADYNLADCIFVTVQQLANGIAVCNFRYKTNEAGANLMLFNTVSPTNSAVNSNGWPIMPIVSFSNSPVLGTWSLTFAQTTNVTITAPNGNTTNFTFDAASAALFADPCSLILGAQPNQTNFYGDAVVYSNFTVTGNASPFSDNFTTDTVLNSNLWFVLASDTNGVVLVPPGSEYWVGWTLPAPGFSFQGATNLPTTNWTSLSSVLTIADNGGEQALVGTNSFPTSKQGYFTLVQRSFSQLLVILPGETNAPGTTTGKVGTPTPVTGVGGGPQEEIVTVLAVDSQFNPIPGITDQIKLSTTDTQGVTPNPEVMVNGSVTFGSDNPFLFSDPGSWSITATDVTTPTITPNTSSPVTVTE